MDSVHGGSSSFKIQSFYSDFPKLASPDASKPNIETFDSKTAENATSASQSSSSSHSLSGGTPSAQPVDEEIGNSDMKRTKTETKIHTFDASKDQESQTLAHKPRDKPEGHLYRVKVTFGEDKIRFKMQKDWCFNELLQEIAKRFSLKDMSGYNLRYLDDDSEWVLITCDADVEECIDVYQSFKGGTIQLTLREPLLRVGSSLGSNEPL